MAGVLVGAALEADEGDGEAIHWGIEFGLICLNIKEV